MIGLRQTWGYTLALSISGAGCAHMMEAKTIEKFATELKEQDLEGLKEHASEEFAGRALRTTDAMADLKILKIPDDGKISVVKVEELSKSHKRVTVEVGEAKREVFYELTKNSSGKWVVDDIYLKQKKQGVEAYKAVSEQMDLLLTVREFLEACDQGERAEVLDHTTPKLRHALEKVPPTYLAKLTANITSGSTGKSKRQKPQAQMTDNTAVVKFPRVGGDTLLTLELQKGVWRVDDVLIDTKDETERLPSLYKEALAVEQCLNFLAAYERNDRESAMALCRPEFYQGGLSLGNWKETPLPSSSLMDHELKASLNGLRADFTLKNEREIVQVTLHRQAEESDDDEPHYQVSNVSIFDIATQQEMRLGALFTARAMGEFYLQALADREVAKLRHSSTKDFSQRVWQRMNEATITTAPLEPFDSGKATIGKAHFDGPLVRLTAMADKYPVELILREESGRFLVDDIRWDIPGRPSTAKATLEPMISVRNFASGLTLGRKPDEQEAALALLQESSSKDFNRMVWAQTQFVPDTDIPAETLLNAPLKSLTMSDTQAIIQLGDSRYGAEVTMIKDRDRFAIDDVVLITGPQPDQRVAMKREYKMQLARGLAQRPTGAVRVVNVTEDDFASPPKIIHPVYEEPAEQPGRTSARPQPPRQLDEPEEAMPIESWDDLGEVQTEPDAE